MKKEENLLKKQMTKKQFKEVQKGKRSQVGLGQNLGTRSFTGEKDYFRAKEKRAVRKQIKERDYVE